MHPPRRPSARLSHDSNINSRNFTDDAACLRYLLWYIEEEEEEIPYSPLTPRGYTHHA